MIGGIMIRKFGFALLGAAAALAPSTASAQTDPLLELDPSGETAAPVSDDDAGDDTGVGTSSGVGIGYGAEPTSEQPLTGDAVEGGLDDIGFYHYDELGQPTEDQTLVHNGPIPELHVVRSGDTLWDICGYYYSNPWEWPKVWSYNPTITNPHWIYPGDLVRLHAAVMKAQVVEDDPDPDAIETATPVRAPATGVHLRQLAFVERKQLEAAFTISGAEKEREMLTQNDTVYLEYPEGKPPQVGKHYAIYSETKAVKHPKSKKQIGSYVRVLGELEVLSVKKGKRARAIIHEANDVIERGARVGPLKRTFKNVDTVPNEKDVQGRVVAQLTGDELIGATQILFVDLGSKVGVQPGNRMFIARRGDAQPDQYELVTTKKNDEKFPAWAIGEILIVDVGAATSMGLVTLSIQELGVGDLVLMRKSR